MQHMRQRTGEVINFFRKNKQVDWAVLLFQLV
jgi:hypothetical protein